MSDARAARRARRAQQPLLAQEAPPPSTPSRPATAPLPEGELNPLLLDDTALFADRLQAHMRGEQSRPATSTATDEIEVYVDNDEEKGAKRENVVKKIRTVKQRLNSQRVPVLEKFDSAIAQELLMVGSISIDNAKRQADAIALERAQKEQNEAEYHEFLRNEIANKTQLAFQRVQEDYQRRVLENERRDAAQAARELDRIKVLNNAFELAEQQLKYALDKRRREVVQDFGRLKLMYDRLHLKDRKDSLEWSDTPQPCELKFIMLRGVKDKLPTGRYVILTSMMTRLGGTGFHWAFNPTDPTGTGREKWLGCTRSFKHASKWENIECPIHESVYTACPCLSEAIPSMCFQFELYALPEPRRKNRPHVPGGVVAWGAFPMFDRNMDVVEGKFRVPLVRGEPQRHVVTYKMLQDVYDTNLDNWLCNLYFEVKHYPRYCGDMREFDVELEYSTRLLGEPDRDDESSSEDEFAINAHGQHTRNYEAPPLLDDDDHHSDIGGINVNTLDLMGNAPEQKTANKTGLKDHEYYNKFFKTGITYDERVNPPPEPVPHLPPTIGVKTDFFLEASRPTHAQKLEEYHYAIDQQKVLQGGNAWSKLYLVYKEVLSHLGMHRFCRNYQWTVFSMTLFFSLISYWLRMYTHYLGEWTVLTWAGVAVETFQLEPYTMTLDYSYQTIALGYEVLVIFGGSLINWLLFSAFMLFIWGIAQMRHSYPYVGNQLVLVFGIFVVLDPWIILITDLIAQNWHGDWFKIYQYFSSKENGGAVGMLIVILIELCIMFISMGILYLYIMKVHWNGRILDLFHRLHGSTDAFMVPFDLEISSHEVRKICAKCERWRGKNGERRKVAVCDFVLKDPSDPSFREVLTHMGIYTLKLHEDNSFDLRSTHSNADGGDREMWRHFVRCPDGAIFEIFGDIDAMGTEEFTAIKRILLNSTGDVNDFVKEGVQLPSEIREDPDSDQDDDNASMGLDMSSDDGHSERMGLMMPSHVRLDVPGSRHSSRSSRPSSTPSSRRGSQRLVQPK